MQPDPIDELSAYAPPVAAILSDWELSAFGDVVEGLDILDFTSDGGETALALAESGARVLNIGCSRPEAEMLLANASPDIQIDAYADPFAALPEELRSRGYDIVYAGPATLEWTENIHDWAIDVFDALKPGGRFIMYDEEPAGRIFASQTEAAELEPTGIEATDLPGAPDDLLPDIPEWTITDLQAAVTGAGLQIVKLEELRGQQRFLTALDELDEEEYPEIGDLPRAFGLIATKPIES